MYRAALVRAAAAAPEIQLRNADTGLGGNSRSCFCASLIIAQACIRARKQRSRRQLVFFFSNVHSIFRLSHAPNSFSSRSNSGGFFSRKREREVDRLPAYGSDNGNGYVGALFHLHSRLLLLNQQIKC